MNSNALNILYEDDFLVICVKPVGVLSEQGATQSSDCDMVALLKARSSVPSKCYIGTVHRLDRNVGGVMVYSKKENITARLSSLIQNHELTKEYLAVVHGIPAEPSGVFKDLLFKDSAKNKSFIVTRMRKGTKEASLEYRLLETVTCDESPLSLVRIKLHTGRTHQIRVQFSGRKLPLVGDGKYGSRDNRCEAALWSYHIAFKHPVTQKTVEGICPPPVCYPFNLFDSSL